ncbi:MAG: thioredoxin family protein [Planctomycetota bacterium]|jgi:small redox-active disulfide protein 2
MKKILVLGPGCPKCTKLAENARQAVEAGDFDFEVEKVTDINEIMKFGVMITPALVVDGEVKSVGKVPSADEIRQMLE